MQSRDICTLDDVEVAGAVVLLRVDINSPIDRATKRIKDDTRVQRSLPTIRELVGKGARVVVLAHQGDPLDYENFTSLKEHAQILSRLLGQEVSFMEDVAGPAAQDRIRGLHEGEVLLLENVRIHTEETIVFEESVRLSPENQAKTFLVRHLAPLADLYVCDAFAAVHRSEPSLVGFPELLPSACGRLFQEELDSLSQVVGEPERPCVFLLGGAKILDAFKMMDRVLGTGSADLVLTGGLTGHIMLLAAGHSLGTASEDFIKGRHLEHFIKPAGELLHRHGERLLCPSDVAMVEAGRRIEVPVSELPAAGLIVDIGQQTVQRYGAWVSEAGTILVNGPMGVYEKVESAYGTRALWQAVAQSPAFSVIGGGDTIAAARSFGLPLESFSYVCTAGGGLVRFLSGERLPVIEALTQACQRRRV